MIRTMPKKKTALARKLIELRERHGDISQEEAAARIGVSTRAWIAWENNQRNPSRLAIKAIKYEFPDFQE